MANYRRYTHLERLGKDEVYGILNGKVSIFSKLDGTNGVMWYDGESVCAGSRNRKLRMDKDNQNFCQFVTMSNLDGLDKLREWLVDNPNKIVYGEWLGIPGQKQLGSIKRYIKSGFHIFDVFDVDAGKYVPYDDYYPEITAFYPLVIPRIAELDNPTEEDVDTYLDKCTYNMVDGDIGEGITIKNYDFTDSWGQIQIAKIVRSDFLENKSKSKEPTPTDDTELMFVDTYCTNALMDKEMNKCLLACGIKEFDKKNSKLIGMIINRVYEALMTEEFFSYYRKKSCTVDLGRIRKRAGNKTRKFLGLI